MLTAFIRANAGKVPIGTSRIGKSSYQAKNQRISLPKADDDWPKGDVPAPNAGVVAAPNAPPLDAPKVDAVCPNVPKAGVLAAPKALVPKAGAEAPNVEVPKAGAEDAPKAGVEEAPKAGAEAAPKAVVPKAGWLVPKEAPPKGLGCCGAPGEKAGDYT